MKKTAFLLVVGLLALTCEAQALAGATLFQKAQQQEAAGNRAAAAAIYQQAYAAYMSVDDSDGMIEALARKKAMESSSPAAVPRATVVRTAASAHSAAPVAARSTVPPAADVAPLAGRTTGGKPVGLFFRMDLSDNQSVYYFTPAGKVFVNPASFSPAGLAAVGPHWRGSYAVNGKEMTIKWEADPAETYRFTFDPTGFHFNASFVGVGPFASAQQVVGIFEGRNAAVRVDANSAALYQTLNFKADGTFTRDNLAASHSEARASTIDANSASQQAGRWRLNGWFLTLTDGRGTAHGVAFPTVTSDYTRTGKVLYFRFNGTTYSNNASR